MQIHRLRAFDFTLGIGASHGFAGNMDHLSAAYSKPLTSRSREEQAQEDLSANITRRPPSLARTFIFLCRRRGKESTGYRRTFFLEAN